MAYLNQRNVREDDKLPFTFTGRKLDFRIRIVSTTASTTFLSIDRSEDKLRQNAQQNDKQPELLYTIQHRVSNRMLHGAHAFTNAQVHNDSMLKIRSIEVLFHFYVCGLHRANADKNIKLLQPQNPVAYLNTERLELMFNYQIIPRNDAVGTVVSGVSP